MSAALSSGSERAAICYVCDRDFLFPSIASAVSLQASLTSRTADIFIFTIDVPAVAVGELNVRFRNRGLRFLDLPRSWQGLYDEADFAKFHVPDACLGRFFLLGALPPGYTRLLYIDGDTLIQGDVGPLMNMVLPDGWIGAAEDPMGFSFRNPGRFGRFVRAYFGGLGLDPHKGYFNSGVFVVSTKTWSQVAPAAFDFFRANIKACRHHDQSALNVVMSGRRVPISLKWNHQTIYKGWNSRFLLKPVIQHFSGYPKPWMGPSWPLSRHFAAYQALRGEIEFDLAPSLTLPDARLRHYSWAKRGKAALNNSIGLPMQIQKFALMIRYEHRAHI